MSSNDWYIKVNDLDDWDNGRLLGIEEALGLTSIYARGALREALWYAGRVADIEAGSDVPPAWLRAILKDHLDILNTKVEVAVALCQAAFREAKLLRSIK